MTFYIAVSGNLAGVVNPAGKDGQLTMNDADKMLVKQFLLKGHQEGYSIVPDFPQSVASEVNIDIYRGNTKICTFDDRQLDAGWYLRVRTEDSNREEIKADYYKLHGLRRCAPVTAPAQAEGSLRSIRFTQR